MVAAAEIIVNISNSLTYTFTGGTSPAVVCTTGTCIVTGNPQTITASGITGYHDLKVNFNGTQNSNSGGEELNVILNADTTGGDYTSVFTGGAGGGNCNYLCAGFLSSLSGGPFYPGGGSFEIIGLDDTGNGFVSLNGTGIFTTDLVQVGGTWHPASFTTVTNFTMETNTIGNAFGTNFRFTIYGEN